MIEAIQKYCAKITTEFELISPERQQLLRKIADYIRRKKSEGSTVNLIYICTHNSRRSHFGQIWAHVAADYYGIDKVYTYSGGTEATAFNPNTINALRRIGFDVRIMKDGNNPVYHIIHDESSSPSVCFSKVYDDVANPQSSFAAIMTCSDAEENCPFISWSRTAHRYDV
jgi:arsenate reductase